MSRKKKNNQTNTAAAEDNLRTEKTEESVTEEPAAEEPVKMESEKTAESSEQTSGATEETSEQTEEPSEEPEQKSGTEEEQDKSGKKERKIKWAKKDDFEEKFREANDKYARLFAEFDNFRKRTEKEKTQRYDFGVRDIVEKILPVIDNFERGLAAVPEDKADDSFVTGMQMTYKLLMKTLEDAGVKPIEAVGHEFNPDFHNAVMHVEDPEVGDNIIVEEFQKGYIYKDHVVRYSMVKVAN